MIRVRGQIGQWPVDLTIEMQPGDWQALMTGLKCVAPTEEPAADLDQALSLLVEPTEGPELLAKLADLLGSSAEAKRVLVRLRHSAKVVITSQDGVQLWQRVGQ